jgi:hypothetical protein
MSPQLAPATLLVALEGRPLSFAPTVHVRAFVLPRPAGDVLVYHSPAVGTAGEALSRVTRQYLGHSHEAMFGPLGPGFPVFVHEADRDAAAQSMTIRATFSRRHTLDADLEVIPMPGHTPGSTAYLWDSGRERYLFTADSLYLHGEEWRVAVLDSSDRDEYLASLALIRDLDFDVLVPWAASADGPHLSRTNRRETRRRLDPIMARVAAEDRGTTATLRR